MLDLAEAFERVSLPIVWAWATHTHFNLTKKILRVLCGFFQHQRRMQFEGCRAEPLQTIMAILLAALTHRDARRVERGHEGVSVPGNEELVGIAEKLLKIWKTSFGNARREKELIWRQVPKRWEWT